MLGLHKLLGVNTTASNAVSQEVPTSYRKITEEELRRAELAFYSRATKTPKPRRSRRLGSFGIYRHQAHAVDLVLGLFRKEAKLSFAKMPGLLNYPVLGNQLLAGDCSSELLLAGLYYSVRPECQVTDSHTRLDIETPRQSLVWDVIDQVCASKRVDEVMMKDRVGSFLDEVFKYRNMVPEDDQSARADWYVEGWKMIHASIIVNRWGHALGLDGEDFIHEPEGLSHKEIMGAAGQMILERDGDLSPMETELLKIADKAFPNGMKCYERKDEVRNAVGDYLGDLLSTFLDQA